MQPNIQTGDTKRIKGACPTISKRPKMRQECVKRISSRSISLSIAFHVCLGSLHCFNGQRGSHCSQWFGLTLGIHLGERPAMAIMSISIPTTSRAITGTKPPLANIVQVWSRQPSRSWGWWRSLSWCFWDWRGNVQRPVQ